MFKLINLYKSAFVLNDFIKIEQHYQSISKNTCYQVTNYAKQKSKARQAVIVILLFNITQEG